MGKTAFVLSMMRNIAVDYHQSVALFSLEMSSVQLVNRLIIGETGISSEKIKTGRLSHEEWGQFERKIKNLSSAPIYIDDTPGISIFELRAKARRLKMLYDVQLIVIDYLQLMSGGGDSQSREQEVSMISRGLKGIAKELNIPIIALSQLNRAVEMRAGDKRPQVSDLRESGAIEQDADIIIFIHRPERFGITEDEQGNSTKGKAEIIIAKHRNGEVCDVPMRFIAEQAKFVDEGYSELEPLPSSYSAPQQGGGEPVKRTFQSKMNTQPNAAPPTYDFNPNQAKGDSEVPF
jgi:replicative DNA helicase